jgi:ParB-like chromosome segregation protein Spo0J
VGEPLVGGAAGAALPAARPSVMSRLPVRSFEIATLCPHPLQGAFYEPMPAAELQALAQSMDRQGLLEPIDVMPANKAGLPPGTVIDGHCRIEAGKLLGWKHIDGRIRTDLAGADAATVELAYLNANQARRHSHPLDRAAVLLRQYELEKGKPRSEIAADGTEAARARDRIGQIIGMSGRNLQRYFAVLMTPRPVQRAVRDGHVPLVMGAKIALLEPAARELIAHQLDALDDPAEAKAIVAGALVPKKASRRGKAGGRLSRFVKRLRQELKALLDIDERLLANEVRKHVQVLKEAIVSINRLVSTVNGDVGDTVSAEAGINSDIKPAAKSGQRGRGQRKARTR